MFSFARHKTIVDLYPYIRRICDLTTPNLATSIGDRSEDRFNRTLPTLICPWNKNAPVVDECTVCLTSDLADRGAGLVLTHPFDADRIVVGYWIRSIDMPQPSFFLGDVRRIRPIGGGFWSMGIEFTEYANAEHHQALAALVKLAANLLPDEVDSCEVGFDAG